MDVELAALKVMNMEEFQLYMDTLLACYIGGLKDGQVGIGGK